MLANYAPVLIFLLVAGVFGLVMLAAGFTLGNGQKDARKLSPYECGFEAFEDTRMRFDVRYYLVAILFIIFDLEIAFLVPWAVALDRIGRRLFFASDEVATTGNDKIQVGALRDLALERLRVEGTEIAGHVYG